MCNDDSCRPAPSEHRRAEREESVGRIRRRWKGKQRRATNCILHSMRSLGDETEEEFNDDLSKPRKVHCKSKWKFSLDAVYRIQRTRKGMEVLAAKVSRRCCLRFQCRPTASKSGVRLRRQNFVSKTLDASAWSEKNSQKCLDFEAAATTTATGTPVAEQNQGTRSSGSKRSTGTPVAEEENPFKVDLRIQGVPQDAVIEDRERMSQIQELVDKLRAGYHTKPIIADLEKEGKSTRFSEESSRTIRELRNIALYDLGEIPRPFNAQRA